MQSLVQSGNPALDDSAAALAASESLGRTDSQGSAVSWAAVFAGAAAAAGLTLLLLMLGVGLGLSAVSPWSISGSSVGRSAILWLAFTQLAACGIGGYLAGRLRVKWAGVHNDEVYFRDTAHGFLAWAVASLMMVFALGGAVRDIVGGTADVAGGALRAGGSAVQALGQAAGQAAASGSEGSATGGANSGGGSIARMLDPTEYFTSTMLRSDKAAPSPDDAALRQEVMGIMANALRNGSLSADDRRYLAQRIATRNGIDPAAAEQRVNQVYDSAAKAANDAKTAAQNAADATRKAAAKASIWMFVALLLGAFVASLTATMGGRQRDRESPVR